MTRVCVLSSVHIALDNRVFYREARSLQAAGYEVTVIAIHARNETVDGIQVLGLPRRPRWQRPASWWMLLRKALASRADVFHFHDPELLMLTPWLRLLAGRPTIYDVHESYPEFIRLKEYLPGWLRPALVWLVRWLEPALARLQSGLIFSDDQIAAAFAHVSRPKTTLFNYPGRDFIRDGLAATQAAGAKQPIVLYLGGMEPNRGAKLVLNAFTRVLAERPDARLWLVGHFAPPELEGDMRGQAEALGISHALEMTGRVPFERIGEYLSQAMIGWISWEAAPKNQKNVPTKLFEYMAYGLPVVSSDLPSTRPYVRQGRSGCLAPAGDPAAHAAAILSLMNDPAGAQAMGRLGLQLVASEYSWEQMEPKLLKLYREVLATEMGG
ncbi:MAG: glycosyltransferase family 4 protein [Candidatus Promineifilaceae bacterium]